MKYKFIISIVLKSLKENKLRSILTILTNLIGMTAILIVILISSSLNHKVTSEVVDTNQISFSIYSKNFDSEGPKPKFHYSENDLDNIKLNNPNIETIAYAKDMTVDSNTFSVKNPVVSEGVNFDQSVGNEVIYNNIDPFATGEESAQKPKYKIGDYIVNKNIRYKIIGITKEPVGFSMPTNFYIPKYLEEQFTTKIDNNLVVTFKNNVDTKIESETVKTELTKTISTSDEIFISDEKAMIRSAINSMTIFFIGIGSISLIVSLVAIINMLFVSVNERKSQIAILRALGMQKVDIALMFVFESLLIIITSTFFASIIALLIALLILKSAAVSLFISFGWIVFTLIFAVILAVLAALLPALNSSKTNISIILR
jgi:putative ABC transport system permease protein